MSVLVNRRSHHCKHDEHQLPDWFIFSAPRLPPSDPARRSRADFATLALPTHELARCEWVAKVSYGVLAMMPIMIGMALIRAMP